MDSITTAMTSNCDALKDVSSAMNNVVFMMQQTLQNRNPSMMPSRSNSSSYESSRFYD